MGSFKLPLVAPGATFNAAQFNFDAVRVALPDAARYPGATVHVLHWRPVAGVAAGNIFAPSGGVVRILDGVARVGSPPGATPGLDRLYELSPLPFSIAAALRALRPGLPTFYLGHNQRAVFTDNAFVRAGDTLGFGGAAESHFYLGVVFQDRVEFEPWAWIKLLEEAMRDAGEAASDPDRANWIGLRGVAAARPPSRLRLQDHTGRATDLTLEFRVVGGVPEWTSRAAAGGEWVLPVVPSDRQIEVRVSPAVHGADARFVYSLYLYDASGAGAPTVRAATAAEAAAPASVLLPAGIRGGCLQVLDLNRWLAARPAPPAMPPWPAWSPLARYHLASRLQPLIDGLPTFNLIVEDLLHTAVRAGGDGVAFAGGAHAAVYSIRDFPMLPSRTDLDTTIAGLARRLRENGGGLRVLAYKFVNLSDAEWRHLKGLVSGMVLGAGLTLSGGQLVLMGFPSLFRASSPFTALFFVAGAVVAGAVGSSVVEAMSLETFKGHVEGLVELSTEGVAALNDAAGPGTAVWSRYAAHLADNPLNTDAGLPLGLHSIVTHVGGWHQKLLVLRRRISRDDAAPLYVAYVGGVEIDATRLDTPGHQGRPFRQPGGQPEWALYPMHDVHARVTGPAALDVIKTWDERYEQMSRSPEEGAGTLAPKLFAPPAPAVLAGQGGGHVVQVGRTYFAPGPSRAGYPYAPNGERTTYDTLLKAIRQAREYIYIEDQYFTPDGVADDPDTYVGALVAAARAGGGPKRLIILVPSENDQPFGAARRNFLYSLLRPAWGDRIIIGALQRRPVLFAPGKHAHEGRCRLLSEEIDESTDRITVGPRTRVPEQTPFWLWVEGELMLCTRVETSTSDGTGGVPEGGTGGVPGVVLQVVRGNHGERASAWGVSTREHKRGAPVTLAQLRGIYVHSKMMLVDDVFVSVGSTNLNRRGFFHDGELNVFAVPEELRAAADNPARALRTALWAEHLGIPPAMGNSLLADPLAAFELFKRPTFVGNRVTPVETFDIKAVIAASSAGGVPESAFTNVIKIAGNVVALTGPFAEAAVLREMWNDAVDPTTRTETNSRPGPTG